MEIKKLIIKINKILFNKKLLFSSLTTILLLVLLSFTVNNGNKSGSATYNKNSIDGVFTVYKITRDFNFGQTPIEYKKFVGFFLQTRGDTSSRFQNGNLSFSNNSLNINAKNFYIDNGNISNGVGNQKWKCNALNNNTVFDYHFKRGQANVDFNQQTNWADTIKTANSLNINFNNISNADSIIVTLYAANGMNLTRRFNGLASGVSFSASMLSSFTSGGIINVSAINVLPITINSKNYLFGSAHQYSKLVYFKN